MMFATPTPETSSVRPPISPRKISIPTPMSRIIFDDLTVSQTPKTWSSSGSKPYFGDSASRKPRSAPSMSSGRAVFSRMLFRRSRPNCALKVEFGTTAWSSSGPWYEPICSLRCMTPTTV